MSATVGLGRFADSPTLELSSLSDAGGDAAADAAAVAADATERVVMLPAAFVLSSCLIRFAGRDDCPTAASASGSPAAGRF